MCFEIFNNDAFVTVNILDVFVSVKSLNWFYNTKNKFFKYFTMEIWFYLKYILLKSQISISGRCPLFKSSKIQCNPIHYSPSSEALVLASFLSNWRLHSKPTVRHTEAHLTKRALLSQVNSSVTQPPVTLRNSKFTSNLF